MPNTGIDVTKGAVGGAAKGAIIGGSIGGPIGMGVGTVIGGVWGGITAGKKSKAMSQALQRIEDLPMVDPNQVAFQDQLAREKRAVESGFTTDFQVSRDILQQSQAGQLSVASKVGASNPALALSMMAQVNQGFTTGMNQALGTISTRSLAYTTMMGDMVDKIAKRKLDIEVFKAQAQIGQAAAEYKDRVEQTNADLAFGIEKAPEIKEGFTDLISRISGGGVQ